VSAWYRGKRTHQPSQQIHVTGCHLIRNSPLWDVVEGWSTPKVIDHVASVPWLRICPYCAERLGLPADHPARHTTESRNVAEAG
jgi:hypothetical protein